MNLNQLYYLQAIAQARGLTRAADALYVTQSNLSHSMAALEEELGIPLLYKKRAGYPAHSVRAGVPRLRRAGHPADRGGSGWPGPGAAPPGGQVRLGFISTVSATLIPWCVSHFYQNPDNQGIAHL